MNLSDFLKQDGCSASRLAELAGVAVSTITRAAKGEIMPSRAVMEAIYRHTGGVVTPNDFFGIPDGLHEGEIAGTHVAASTGHAVETSGRSAASA